MSRSRSEDKKLNAQIEESAEYLRERKRSFTEPIGFGEVVGPVGGAREMSIPAFNVDDSESAELRLKKSLEHLEKAGREIDSLVNRASTGRALTAGLGLQDQAMKANAAIVRAITHCALAREDVISERQYQRKENSVQRDQLGAVRLALACFPPEGYRGARAVAKKIMEKAEIPIPSESGLSGLLKRVREENSSNAKSR